jgi:wobble nucleotide-excising tRNase
MAPPKIASFSKIRNAVIFADYNAAADLPVFQSKNLIYGFNGTGKTTLTRLLTSVFQGQLDPRLPSDCEFAIKLDDGAVVTQTANLDRLKDVVRAYNSEIWPGFTRLKG